jgi:RHS repeat-associated protein
MIGGYSTVSWDNAVATTNTTPGTVVSYDDLDAWGMVLEGRSGNSADGRQRFKFTGKERDNESKYDYFGARYFDARIARWLAVDPLAERYPGWAPFAYVGNNPLGRIDPDGKKIILASGSSDKFKEQFANTVKFLNNKGTAGNLAALQRSAKTYTIKEVSSLKDDSYDPASRTISWDPNHAMQTTSYQNVSPATIFGGMRQLTLYLTIKTDPNSSRT